ncbi:MAG: 50S ribosomal protein L23 [Christensenellales bacterium]|jgi:large subunit ribosomal protein L23
MKSPYDIIIRPVLTEKTYEQMAEKRYTFQVAVKAGKTEIKEAIETIFGVEVAHVNTVRQIGKIKRQGRTQGRRPERKKAYVTLTESSKGIEFFEGMGQV